MSIVDKNIELEKEISSFFKEEWISRQKAFFEKECISTTPDTILDILVSQKRTVDSCELKIDFFKAFVRQINGTVVANPAIKTRDDAQKQIVAILAKYGRKKKKNTATL